MKHINYQRSVTYTGRRTLEEILPESGQSASFAAFCGSNAQRRAVGLQGVRRCCGRMGVVVLQNDPMMAYHLGQLRQDDPQLARRAPGFRTLSVNPEGNGYYYDPLYGLNADGVLNAILPDSAGGYGAVSTVALRGYLSAYLDLMALQFARSAQPFGRYPYNLDLLLDLTRMPLQRLDEQVLRFLPPEGRQRIYARLSGELAQQQCSDAVEAFARELQDRLWQYRGFGGHTRTSIVEAVRNRQLINIHVSFPRPALMGYLYEELRTLIEAGDRFLLVVCNVPLDGSPQLRSLFTREHDDLNYSTGLLAGSLSHVVEQPEDLGLLMASHREVLVFGCASAMQAQPFSEALGTYQRLVRERHTQRQRQPFHLFAAHGEGEGVREVTEHNINVQELMSLEDGAVLCGGGHRPPEIIRHIQQPRQNGR